MSIKVTFRCDGCHREAEATRPYRREFHGINGKDYGFGSYVEDSIVDIAPPGWVPFCPADCTYCPKCAEGLWPEKGQSEHEEGRMIDSDDICGFCGKDGADKVPHPHRWPGEESAGTTYVHAECEDAECARAHSRLTDKERERFLRTVL